MAPMSVAVVNFNTHHHLHACLATVLAEGPAEVVVADNGSTDGSVEMLRAEYPDVRLQVHPHNPGYGTAANHAIGSCRSPYVLLLNSDTELRPGALRALGGHLDRHPRAALVGPRLLNPDGTLQPSCYPFPGSLAWLVENGTPAFVTARVPRLRRRSLRTWAHDTIRQVPFVQGAAIAIRRSAFDQVGGFDDGFFMYAEEADLCLRLAAAGWEIHFAPVTDVTHAGEASTGQQRTEMVIEHYRADLRFYRRHYPAAQVAALVALRKGIVLARLLRDAIRLECLPGRNPGLAEDVAAWKRLLIR